MKNSLLLNDLQQRINDSMFDNPFIDQHIIYYSNPSDDENDEMLNLNVSINVNNYIDDDS